MVEGGDAQILNTGCAGTVPIICADLTKLAWDAIGATAIHIGLGATELTIITARRGGAESALAGRCYAIATLEAGLPTQASIAETTAVNICLRAISPAIITPARVGTVD